MEYHIAIKHFHFKKNSMEKFSIKGEKWFLDVHVSFSQFLKNVYLYI